MPTLHPPATAPTTTTPNNETARNEEALKSALWYSIGQTLDAIALDQNLNATPHFIGGLSEMVYAQIETVAQDIEAFARHDGGRKTVTAGDVVLLGRRNEGLEMVLEREARAAKESGGGR